MTIDYVLLANQAISNTKDKKLLFFYRNHLTLYIQIWYNKIERSDFNDTG